MKSRDHLQDCERCSMAKIDQEHECDKISLQVFLEKITGIVRISVRLVVESEESPVHEDIFVFNDQNDQGLLQGSSEYGLRVFKQQNESICIIARKKFKSKSAQGSRKSSASCESTEKLHKCIYCLKVERTNAHECEEIFVQVQPFSKDSCSGVMDPSQTFAYKQLLDDHLFNLPAGDSFFLEKFSIMNHDKFSVDSASFGKFIDFICEFRKAQSLQFTNVKGNFEVVFKHDESSTLPIPTLYQLQQNIEQLRLKQDALRTVIYSHGVSEWFEYCFRNAVKRKIIFDEAETQFARFVMPNGPPCIYCQAYRLEKKDNCLLVRLDRDDGLLQVGDFMSLEQKNKRYYFRLKTNLDKDSISQQRSVLLEHIELSFDVPLESVQCIQCSQQPVQLVRHPILHFLVKIKKDNAFVDRSTRKLKNHAFLKKVLEWEINDSRNARLSDHGYSMTLFNCTELAITALFLNAAGEATDKSFDGVRFPTSFHTLRHFPFGKLDMG